MRIWSLNPKYLDRQGLLACWRETLLAQKVLQGGTRGYRNHPQLLRFHLSPQPLESVATYLVSLADEADVRGYLFDRSRIEAGFVTYKISVSQGQILFEWEHLKSKLAYRNPHWLAQLSIGEIPECHPLFQIVPGTVENWERTPALAND